MKKRNKLLCYRYTKKIKKVLLEVYYSYIYLQYIYREKRKNTKTYENYYKSNTNTGCDLYEYIYQYIINKYKYLQY